jgi:hypothetical protein
MRRELVALGFDAHYLEVKGVPAGRKKRLVRRGRVSP